MDKVGRGFLDDSCYCWEGGVIVWVWGGLSGKKVKLRGWGLNCL